MRKMVLVSVLAAVAGVAIGQEPVKVVPTEGGMLFGVDMLAGKNAEGKREQGWTTAVWQGAKKHKWKIAAGLAAATAVEMVADHNDYLWHKQDKARPNAATSSPAATPAQAPAQAPAVQPASTSQAAGGDASQTVNNYTATHGGTISINVAGGAE